MKEFNIKFFLILKLEDEKSIIYVEGEKFDQCKSLFLTIPIPEIQSLDEVKTIDEIAEKLFVMILE